MKQKTKKQNQSQINRAPIFNTKTGMFSTTTTVCSMGHTTPYKLSPTFESASPSAITLFITVDRRPTLPTSANDVP